MERIPQSTAPRWFARAAQTATWVLALTWGTLIVFASGALTNAEPLAARLPDLLATTAYVGAILVGAAVVHTVLEAAIAVLRMAGDARSLPAIEKNVRLNAQLPSVISTPAPALAADPEPEPRVTMPVARPVDGFARRRPASA